MTFATLPITPIHLFFVLFSFFWIIRSDWYGLTWIRGIRTLLENEKLDVFHTRVWVGLVGIIVTGLLLVAQRTELLTNFFFWFKMCFVGVLLVNSFFINKEMILARTTPFVKLSRKQKTYIFLVGAISTISWISAFILGEVLAELR